MVEEWSETSIHGRFGWKAIPFALDDLDSNFVSIVDDMTPVVKRQLRSIQAGV